MSEIKTLNGYAFSDTKVRERLGQMDIPKVFIDGAIPTTKDDVLAEMSYVSKSETFHAYLKIKCQGSSSMGYPKKNFTVSLYSDAVRETKLKKVFRDWGVESSKFVLKANYIDHSHARNIVCANLWDEVVSSRADYDTLPAEFRNSPRNGAIDGFPIKVYTNGTYQGIYTWNIGKDAWMWGMNEDNPNHVLMCGETNTDGVYAETACNFRALWSGTDGDMWSVEVGTNSDDLKTSLNNLISCVKDTDDETFKATIGNYLDVQSAIDYYIHQYVICGLDGLAKNMLLGTYDGTHWMCGAYDMDSTFGLWWNGTKFVSTEYRCPEDYQEPFSLLWERIVGLYTEEIKSRYAQLRNSVYTYANIITKAERFTDIIGNDLYAEDLEIYPSIPLGADNNIRQIRNYTRDRLAYCDRVMRTLGTGETYTDLTYLEGDGNQYIDTGISGGTNAAYEILVHHTSEDIAATTYAYLLAGSKGNAAPFVQFYSWDGFHVNTGDNAFSCAIDLPKSVQNITLGCRYNSDGTVYSKWGTEDWLPKTPSAGDASVVAGRGWGDKRWYVFNCPDENIILTMRLYYLKMYTEGVLVRDFIPVRRNSDGAYGLFDNVSGEFFGNMGTGAFTGM